jgi:hypothetical protein
MYRWSNAENFGSVRLVVREKISSRTDRHGEYINIFSDEKSAKNDTESLKKIIQKNLFLAKYINEI